MAATLVLVSLLLAPAASGATETPAAPAACHSYSRGAQPSPPLVREWLAHSADERVLVCPADATEAREEPTALYFGEGPVTRRGAVCSYLSHGLTLTGAGAAARLQRYEHTEALAMALAGADCPRPHAGAPADAYIETYDVSPGAFVGIMRLWSATTATLAGAGGGPAKLPPEARARLESALGQGRVSAATVTRIVRIPGSVFRHRYALFLRVPSSAGSAALYVVYVDKSLRVPYEITAFAETS